MIKKDVFDDAHYPKISLDSMLNYFSVFFPGTFYVSDSRGKTRYKGEKNTA